MSNLLKSDNLQLYSNHIDHFFSTRKGGISTGNYSTFNVGNYTNDDPVAIKENRRILSEMIGISPDKIINPHQTHGVQIKIIDESFINLPLSERDKALDGYDGLLTALPSVCIAVTTADCVPVLLYDTRHNIVSAIHSGWRSTLHNIVSEAVSVMHKTYNTQPEDLVAAIGPCIGKKVYEVGEEVYQQFTDIGFEVNRFFEKQENEKYLFDIRETVKNQLINLHIPNIEVSPFCTYCHDDLFFSARRQGIDSGRMLNGIMIK